MLSTVNIAGRWATDDFGTNIFVNDTPTGSTSGGYTSWTNFTITQSLLQSGLNTIAFVVLNNTENPQQYPTGLRVEFTTATASPVPLPASLLLFASGLGAIGLYSRRKKRKAELA